MSFPWWHVEPRQAVGCKVEIKSAQCNDPIQTSNNWSELWCIIRITQRSVVQLGVILVLHRSFVSFNLGSHSVTLRDWIVLQKIQGGFVVDPEFLPVVRERFWRWWEHWSKVPQLSWISSWLLRKLDHNLSREQSKLCPRIQEKQPARRRILVHFRKLTKSFLWFWCYFRFGIRINWDIYSGIQGRILALT